MPRCHYHPDSESNCRCAECDRYICGKDSVVTPEGLKCARCASAASSHAFRGHLTSYARAISVAALLAAAGGLLVARLLSAYPLLDGASFWVIVFFGAALGEATRRAAGGSRAFMLMLVAAAAAASGTFIAGLGLGGMVFSAGTAVLFLRAGP